MLSTSQACKPCKTRKVKCNRAFPCSACTTANIACPGAGNAGASTQAYGYPKEQEVALQTITKDVAEILSRIKALSPTYQTEAVHASIRTTPSDTTFSNSGTLRDTLESPFEGSTSFANHVQQSLEALQLFPDLGSKETTHLHEQESGAFSIVRPETECKTYNLSALPPASTIIDLLTQNLASTRFFEEYWILSVGEFSHSCRQIYFPLEPTNDFAWLEVNVGLAKLFGDDGITLSPALGISQSTLEEFSKRSYQNCYDCLSQLSIAAKPSMEACRALCLAVSIAMKRGWRTAAKNANMLLSTMVIDLGWHRIPSGTRNPTTSTKRRIFWYAYLLDKGLSCTLGRSAMLQDYDFTIERPILPDDLTGFRWWYTTAFIILANIQGDIYSQLYSAAAQQVSAPNGAHAENLANRLETLLGEHELLINRFESQNQYQQDSLLSVYIVKDCLLTLIYRAIPEYNRSSWTQTSSQKCLQVARNTLYTLLNAWNSGYKDRIEAWQTLLSWVFLFVPFIPFVVIVEEAIVTNSTIEFDILQNVLGTFQTNDKRSSSVSIVSNTCQKLYDLARQVTSPVLHEIENVQQDHTSSSFLVAQQEPLLSLQDWINFDDQFEQLAGYSSNTWFTNMDVSAGQLAGQSVTQDTVRE